MCSNAAICRVFINASHVTKLYADEIQRAREQAHAVLEQIAKISQPQATGVDLKAVVEMYSSLLDGIFQMVDDAGGSSVAITISAKKIGIEKYTTFADGSATAESLAAQPTSTMDALAKQPSDAVGYFGISGDMHRMIEWSMSMTKGMLGFNPEQEKALEEAAKAWEEIDFKEMTGSLSIGSAEEGLLQYSVYAQATPVDQIRKSMHEYATSFGNIEVGGMKQTMTLQEDAETIDSRPVDVMTMTQEFPPELDPTGMQSRMQKLMFGPDGIDLTHRLSRRRLRPDDGRRTQADGVGPPGDRQHAECRSRRASGGSDRSFESAGDVRSAEPWSFGVCSQPTRCPTCRFEIDTDELMQLDLDTSYVGVALAAEEERPAIEGHHPCRSGSWYCVTRQLLSSPAEAMSRTF